MAISAPATGLPPPEPDRADRLLDLVNTAQVGGAFWSAADPWRDDPAPLAAPGDSERIAVAAIVGRAATVTRPGRFGTPATGPDRAAVAAHLLSATRYRDPFSGDAIEAEQAVALLADWRRQLDANRDLAVAVGMAWWKRHQIRTFLWSGRRGSPRFVRGTAAACDGAARSRGAIAAWPSRISPDLAARAASLDVPVVRVEDGFIRSVGLGSGLHPPFSVAIDRQGIHYDPSAPSDLETLIESGSFPPELIARAARLRQEIVARGIGKYGHGTDAAPVRPAGRRLVLVTGQVSDDLSVLAGGHGIAGNDELLGRARAAEPDAEIWFRPHPDVDAGHRTGAIPDAVALRFADRVVRGGGMAALLDRVDGVHVLTSLAGFEALLRGRDVSVHGLPFYAGWGLTRDLAAPPARRTRRITLDELVAATLILYPRYLDPVTGLPCPVETLVARLSAQTMPRSSLLLRLRALQGKFSRARR